MSTWRHAPHSSTRCVLRYAPRTFSCQFRRMPEPAIVRCLRSHVPCSYIALSAKLFEEPPHVAYCSRHIARRKTHCSKTRRASPSFRELRISAILRLTASRHLSSFCSVRRTRFRHVRCRLNVFLRTSNSAACHDTLSCAISGGITVAPAAAFLAYLNVPVTRGIWCRHEQSAPTTHVHKQRQCCLLTRR